MPGYNAVARMVQSPKSERRPEVFYFGDVDSAEPCRDACERAGSACAAFAWMGPAKRGMFGGTDKWARGCYGRAGKNGRGQALLTMIPEKDRVSGRKVHA